MFKRVAKKQKKRERDEELGLDDDAKQMFGMQDTDSDESSSDTDRESNSSGTDDDGDDLDLASDVDMKTEWLAAEGGDTEDEDESDEEELDLDEDVESPISLSQAVKNPIYFASPESDVHACIVCPKKLLKNDKMVKIHVSSAAHIRRFKKFSELAESPKYRSKDPRRVAAAVSQKPKAITNTNTEGMSKRGMKRKQKLEMVKQRREKTKQIIERKKRKSEKKEAPEVKTDNNGISPDSNAPSSERPHKKRRVSAETSLRTSGGGDSVDDTPGDQAAVKPTRKKAKTKPNAKPGATADIECGDTEALDSESKQKGKTKTSKANVRASNVRIFEDDGTIREEDVRSAKKRDLVKMKTKGHKGRASAGRFAKLSDTRQVKDKSRGSRAGGKNVDPTRNHTKATRYFEEPEAGTDSKELGPKKVSGKKERSEARESHGIAKRGGVNRKEKTQGRSKEKVTDDLVIFD